MNTTTTNRSLVNAVQVCKAMQDAVLTAKSPVREPVAAVAPMPVVVAHKCTYANRAGARSVAKRRILATVLMLAKMLGHSDGKTWADCAACGETAHVGGAPLRMDTFNLGHVLADANGGTFCPCNLLPLCRQCNSDMGDETMTDVLVPLYDPRADWDGVLVKDTGTNENAPMATRGRARWTRPETALLAV